MEERDEVKRLLHEIAQLSREAFEGPKHSVWNKLWGWLRVLLKRVLHRWDFEAMLIIRGQKAPLRIFGTAVMIGDLREEKVPLNAIIIAPSGQYSGLAELALLEGVTAIVTVVGGIISHFAIRANEAAQVGRGEQVAFFTGAEGLDEMIKTGDQLEISIIEGVRKSFIRKLS